MCAQRVGQARQRSDLLRRTPGVEILLGQGDQQLGRVGQPELIEGDLRLSQVATAQIIGRNPPQARFTICRGSLTAIAPRLAGASRSGEANDQEDAHQDHPQQLRPAAQPRLHGNWAADRLFFCVHAVVDG
ncbi:MAG: hypothetical protein CVU38_17975 [Chloroflexi bacterium HGW-Chloroflexi-1]|nr:MAG: hypothetical protein CVU38_17975 [Chloroflexi bacterium HGW-Chloroflexi-1]